MVDEKYWKECVHKILEGISKIQDEIGWNNGQIINALSYIISTHLQKTAENGGCLTSEFIIKNLEEEFEKYKEVIRLNRCAY